MLSSTIIPLSSHRHYIWKQFKMIYIVSYGTYELRGEMFVAAYGNKAAALEHARTELNEMIKATAIDGFIDTMIEIVKDNRVKIAIIDGQKGIESDWYIIEETTLMK